MKTTLKALGFCLGLFLAVWLVQGEAVERFIRGSVLALDGTPTASLPSSCVNGQFRYDSTLGKLVQCSSNLWSQISGSGGGGVNYHDDFECDTISNVATYDDGASTPTDGTGGTVNYASATLESSSPLSGAGSYKLSKSANNAQGEGWAVDSDALDDLEAGGPNALWINFSYKTSANYASGDVTIYAYRVGSSTLEAVNTFQGSSFTNSLPAAPNGSTYAGWITASSSDTSIRLILHVASTNATAYDIHVDRLSIGPQSVVQSGIATDWVSYTPTITGFGTPSGINVFSRRVGDTLEVQGYFTSGTSTATQAQITLGFNGANANVTTASSTKFNGGIIGKLSVNKSSATYFGGAVLSNPSTGYVILAQQTSTSDETTPLNGNLIASSGQFVEFAFQVPISGWTSGNVMSTAELQVRSVKARAYRATSDQTLSHDTSTKIQLNAENFDSHNAFDSTTNYRFVAPHKMTVLANGSIGFDGNATNVRVVMIYKNGSEVARTMVAALATDPVYNVSTVIELEKDDYVELYGYQNSGGNLGVNYSSSQTYLSITAISDLTVFGVTGTPPVNARYTSTAGQSISNGSTAIIDFATLGFDTHNAVTTGASWKFTAPIGGKYQVNASMLWGSAAFSSNVASTIYIYKNGSLYASRQHRQWAALTTSYQQTISDVVNLSVGDYIDIRVDHGESAARSIHTAAGYTSVSISKISD